jgi:K+-sensing histidine kinase KdpD
LERTKELQKSNEKLLKAQHDLNNFLYKTSHDIRGPVATLKGLYNLITTKQNEPEELKDLIVRVGVQIEKIYKILNRISMVTSIQNTFLKPEVIDFHALLNDIVDFERKNGQLKHIRVLVDVEPGLKMISDPYLIHLILENMVDNSLKFFNESTRIDPYVKITVSTSGSDALIKVEDNGVGIIMKPGQDVFTMFLRGSERSDIGGVGLYLCKVIADKLEGTIKLEKTSKEGTTFSLKLTLDATEQIKAWNTYLESEYRQEMERQVEYEKREQDAEQGGKASNPFIAT